MYQSFPQTVYTKQESAMPRVPKPAEQRQPPLGNMIASLATDDWILIGILLLLFSEESDDRMLMLMLAFLLFF